jgi:hypothetical protein
MSTVYTVLLLVHGTKHFETKKKTTNETYGTKIAISYNI